MSEIPKKELTDLPEKPNSLQNFIGSGLSKIFKISTGFDLERTILIMSNISKDGEKQTQEFKDSVKSTLSKNPELKNKLLKHVLSIPKFKKLVPDKLTKDKFGEIIINQINISKDESTKNNIYAGLVYYFQDYYHVQEDIVGEETIKSLENPYRKIEAAKKSLNQETKQQLEKEKQSAKPNFDQKSRLKQLKEGFLPKNELNKFITNKETPTYTELLIGLKKFQKENQLTVDGRIGPNTGAKLIQKYSEETKNKLTVNTDYKGKNFFKKGGYGILKQS